MALCDLYQPTLKHPSRICFSQLETRRHWFNRGNAVMWVEHKSHIRQNSFKQLKMVLMPCRASKSEDVWQSLWGFVSQPTRFIYSSDITDVDTVQLSELWAKTIGDRRDPQDIARALKHSYMFVVVLEQTGWNLEASTNVQKKRVVGFGRAVSDGAFIATICDVAVDPAYQRKGIGHRIVKELIKGMKKQDGPTGFAVFPPPRARRFFWTLGFRSDRQFRFMIYRGRLLGNAVEDENH